MDLGSILILYYYPVQLILGTIGNILCMVALLNVKSRSSFPIFISLMALMDLLYLVSLFPHWLSSCGWLDLGCPATLFMGFLINWWHSAAAWILIATAVECFCFQMVSNDHERHWFLQRPLVVVPAILCVSFAVSIFHYLEFACGSDVETYYDPQIDKIVSVTQITMEPQYEQYVYMSKMVEMGLFHVLPMLLAVFYGMLFLRIWYRAPHISYNKRQIRQGITLIVLCYVIANAVPFYLRAKNMANNWTLTEDGEFHKLLYIWSFSSSTGKVGTFFLLWMGSQQFRNKVISCGTNRKALGQQPHRNINRYLTQNDMYGVYT